MISMMRQRLNKEEGFTLVELMVVVLIIAILIAIAIPTFLGARERAQDRAAQSNLRNALTSEKVHYTDEEEYADSTTDADASGIIDLTEIEPSLTFAAVPLATDVSQVGVTICEVVAASGDNAAVALQVISASGTTFTLLDISSGVNAGTYYASVAEACTAVPGANFASDGF